MRAGARGVARLGPALAAVALVALATGARAGVVEYLYVDANVGDSSGGHVAIHFPETEAVYDYQNDALDNLRLRRELYQQFRYLYSVRGNRTIHVARVEVPDDTHDALLARFNRALLIQDKLYRLLDAARDEVALVELLAERDPGAPGQELPATALRLPGSGFFYGGPEPAPGTTSAALVALRARVAGRYGETFLAERLDALGGELRDLDLGAAPALPERVSPAQLPRAGYRPSERIADLSLQILALRTLADVRPLRPQARRTGGDAGFALDATERERVAAFADALEARLVELCDSGRPDWGFALLLGMARLEALRESAASGRLVLLDAIPDRATPLPPGEIERSRPYLEEMAAWSRARFLAQRDAFFTGGRLHEPDLARLEAAASRYLEIDEGLRSGRGLRLEAGLLAPDLAASAVEVPLPQMDAAALERARAEGDERLRGYERALHGAFGYGLLDHNCVTEIFAMLGGDGPGPLGMIPFVSYARFARSSDPVLGALVLRGEIPSYRRTRLGEMYAEENDLLVHLRESNTFTSTVYRRSREDSFFVFFTDDAPLLRPLYGAVNVLAGVGEMLAGVLAAPLDRGQMLWSGAKGAFFSLPELAFVNVRKGRLDYAPADPPRTALRAGSEP